MTVWWNTKHLSRKIKYLKWRTEFHYFKHNYREFDLTLAYFTYFRFTLGKHCFVITIKRPERPRR